MVKIVNAKDTCGYKPSPVCYWSNKTCKTEHFVWWQSLVFTKTVNYTYLVNSRMLFNIFNDISAATKSGQFGL